MPAKSKNRIDRARYDHVMFYRTCPGCGDYVIIDVVKRSKSDALSRDSKYLGTFHTCGGNGTKCWHMTSLSGDKPLYETFGPEATNSRPK
jgi:pyruvate/2-oxoacid:ferredoxin oxidoreductase beta subunit